MFGGWDIKVTTTAMPQKIATMMDQINEIVGAKYEFIAYLGSQEVNGVNHAVLAKQVLVLGEDVTNVVVLIFHETKEGVSIASIERVVEQGAKLGGTVVEPTTAIPVEAKEVFDKAFEGFVGSKVEPFAYLGKQPVNGTNYIFAAVMTPVVQDAKAVLKLVVINDKSQRVSVTDLMANKNDTALGYAFTWM